MTCYVALLGSINVGGNRLKMAELKSALSKVGLGNIKTVVASGNVLFDYEQDANTELEQRIASCLKTSFDIESFAVIFNKLELESILSENPFVTDGNEKFIHIHFLERQIQKESFEKLLVDYEGRGDEKIIFNSRALHINYLNGVGRSKLTSDFMERRLGCRGTARNINSLRRIIGNMR